MGAPRFGSVSCFTNHYPRSREHFLIPSARSQAHLFGGLGLSYATNKKAFTPAPTWPTSLTTALCNGAINRIRRTRRKALNGDLDH